MSVAYHGSVVMQVGIAASNRIILLEQIVIQSPMATHFTQDNGVCNVLNETDRSELSQGKH